MSIQQQLDLDLSMSSVTNVLAVARSGVTPKDAFTGSQYNTSLSRNDF